MALCMHSMQNICLFDSALLSSTMYLANMKCFAQTLMTKRSLPMESKIFLGTGHTVSIYNALFLPLLVMDMTLHCFNSNL